jgi:hypothetical protein
VHYSKFDSQCRCWVKTRMPPEGSHVGSGQLRTRYPTRSILPCDTSGCEQSQQGSPLFDHLVGARKHSGRQIKAKRLGGFQVEHQLVFHRRLHQQLSRRFTLENAIDVAGRTAELIDQIRPIGDQTAVGDRDPPWVNRRQPVACSERYDRCAMSERQRASPFLARRANAARARSISSASRTPTRLNSIPE